LKGTVAAVDGLVFLVKVVVVVIVVVVVWLGKTAALMFLC
jgi:hypothetical protein